MAETKLHWQYCSDSGRKKNDITGLLHKVKIKNGVQIW